MDANEVMVSSKIPGRIQTLTVEEGQDVKAGELIATIESDDLAAATQGRRSHCRQRQSKAERDPGDGTAEQGETSSATHELRRRR